MCVSITQNITQHYMLLMKTDWHFFHLYQSSLLICDLQKLTDHCGWFFFRNDDICSATYRARALSSRYSLTVFFLAGTKGNDEERVRMNVTPAERRGSRAKTTSRTPLAWLLFLFVLFSSFSFLIFLFSLPFSPLCTCIPFAAIYLTHDSSLCNVRTRLVARRLLIPSP